MKRLTPGIGWIGFLVACAWGASAPSAAAQNQPPIDDVFEFGAPTPTEEAPAEQPAEGDPEANMFDFSGVDNLSGGGAAPGAEGPAVEIPPEVVADFEAGRQLYEEEEYRDASSKLQKALVWARDNQAPYPEASYYLGLTLMELGDVNSAGGLFQSAIAADEEKLHKEYRVAMAEALNQMQGGAQQALQFASEAIEIDGTDSYAEGLHQRGVAYRNLRMEDEALEDLNKAAELASADEKIQYDLGVANVDFEHFEEGIASLTRAIDLAPADEPYTAALIARNAAFIRYAKLPENRGRARELLQSAVADARAAIAAEESEAIGNFNLGVALRYLGDYDAAIEAFTEALAQNIQGPVSAQSLGLGSEIHLRRGIVWFYQGDYDLALGDFEDGLLNVGTEPDARLLLWKGLTLAKLGRYADAIGAYTGAVSNSTAYEAAYFNRGLAYLRSGNADKALEDFNAYVRIRPHDAEGYLHRALALSQLGDQRGAASAFARAKSFDPQVAETEIGRRLAGSGR